MTVQDALRDKIARALKEVSDERLTDTEFEMFGDTPVTDFYPEADAVLAVLDVGEIRAEAWGEGSAAGWHDAMRYEASGWGKCEWAGLIKNPYRPEGEEQ